MAFSGSPTGEHKKPLAETGGFLKGHLYHSFKKTISASHIAIHMIMAIFVFPAVPVFPIYEIAEHPIKAVFIG